MKQFRNQINSIIYGNKITTALRIIIGLLFIYSGFFKIIDMENFSKVIARYDISPEVLIPYAAVIVPHLELVLGILFFTGYKIKASALIGIILMLFWTIFISINVYRGKSFDCGCFELNKFGLKEDIGLPIVFRDIVLLGIFLLIFKARLHILSLDKKIEERHLLSL